MRGLSITRGWVQDPQCFPATMRGEVVCRLRENRGGTTVTEFAKRHAIRQVCERHSLTVEQLSRKLLYHLCGPLPLKVMNAFADAFNVCQRMLEEAA